MSKNTLVVVLAGLALLAMAVVPFGYALAQENDQPAGRQAQRGGGTPEERAARIEQARTRMLEQAREQLGFTEEEWTQVKPRYEKVTELNRELNMGGMMGMRGAGRRGRGGPEAATATSGPEAGAPGAAVAQSELAKARQGLRDVLANEQATNEQIKTALSEYRTAHTKAEADLAAARTDLRGLLNIRQEAMLVSQGLLD
jgi:hypothetical protein